MTRLGLPSDVPTAYAVSEGEPQDAAIQRGGDPGRPGPVVPRSGSCFGFLKAVSCAAVPERSSGRAQLAQWITRDDHPLTARVIVNRVWQHHFGRGIVATPSNFGIRGEPPSHPELLDWLTAWFISHGWSIKDLHRQILLSRTYQLSSDFDQQNALIDPGNRWLWHFQRSRLDAESIRDAMLSVSGQLDRRRPPAHPFPPIETWRWTQHNAFKEVYASQHRSVFLMTQRLVKHPYLAIFDGPDTNTSTDVRPHSTVPTQALFLMNNPFVEAQAEAFARRLTRRRERSRAASRACLGDGLGPAALAAGDRPCKAIPRKLLHGTCQRRNPDAENRARRVDEPCQDSPDVQRVSLCGVSSNDSRNAGSDDLMINRHTSSGGTHRRDFLRHAAAAAVAAGMGNHALLARAIERSAAVACWRLARRITRQRPSI